MASSADVPGRLPVAVEGHAYQIEPSGFKRETVQVLRQQADASTEPGEASLNPQGLWRRSQESWHHGAGQAFLDGKEGLSAYSAISADPHRYRSSKGIDPWTRGQLSLLHPTLNVWATTNTNLYLAVSDQTNYFVLNVADGNQMYFAAIPYGVMGSLALQTGTGWTPTNATISVSPTGTGFRLTSAAGGAVSVTSPTGTAGIPVDPGRQYAATFKAAIGSGSGRFFSVSVRWYTSAGAIISTTTPTTSSNSDNPASQVIQNPTAPATAAYAALILAWATNFGAGEYHDVQAATLAPYDDVSTATFADPWTSADIQAGQAAQPIQALTTDGYYVWAALGTSGLHRNEAGVASSTADVPAAPASGQISLAGYANGFLLAAGSAGVATTRQNTLWVVNDPLGTPALSVVKTHPNVNFVWTGIAPGRNCVYAFGNSGGNGEIYKILFDPNTGSLSSAASFATYLPDGETIHALQFYAGGIVMGTGRGVRLGQADGTGNIDYGPLVPTTWPVRCLEPQDRYCWFGWTKYDTVNSGLGRVDLGFFTDTLTPAWASDLMTSDTTTGDVVACVTFAPYGYTANQRPPVRVFTVAGRGVYIEDPGSRVPSGDLHTGTIRFSTSEPKLLRSIDVRHHALPAGASVQPLVARDSNFNSWEGLLPSNTTGSYGSTAASSGAAAESFELWFGLSRPTPSGTDYSISLEMTRWTAKALPQPSTIDETFTIPILMRHEVVDNNDANYKIDVPTEVSYLKGLEQARTLVNLQTGNTSQTVYLLASSFEGQNWGPGRTYVEGIMTTVWQTVRG